MKIISIILLAINILIAGDNISIYDIKVKVIKRYAPSTTPQQIEQDIVELLK